MEVRLEYGESRIFDLVPFVPPTDHPSCQYESFHLEVAVEPISDPSMSGRDLAVEIWFAQEVGGERREHAATELRAGQADAMRFVLAPLVEHLPGVRIDGEEVSFRVQCKGNVRAWSSGPDTVEVQIEPSIHFEWTNQASLSSGRGKKSYAARLGETVELEMPRTRGQFRMIAPEGFEVIEPAPEGITYDGTTVQVDKGRLLEDTRFSIVIRVSLADPPAEPRRLGAMPEVDGRSPVGEPTRGELSATELATRPGEKRRLI